MMEARFAALIIGAACLFMLLAVGLGSMMYGVTYIALPSDSCTTLVLEDVGR